MQPYPRFGGVFAEWPQRDIARPESSANGLAIKAVMLIHMEGRERRVQRIGQLCLQWELRGDLQALKGLAEDAARLIPEAAPLVATVIGTPMELPPIRAELRERAEALIAEYDGP